MPILAPVERPPGLGTGVGVEELPPLPTVVEEELDWPVVDVCEVGVEELVKDIDDGVDDGAVESVED